MVKVMQCCCGCSLRTGNLIIGYLYMAEGILAILASTVFLIIINTGGDPLPKDGDPRLVNTVMSLVWAVVAVMGLIQIVLSIFLVYGGHKGKPGFLMPWMIYSWIMFGLTVLALVVSFKQVIMGNNLSFIKILVHLAHGALLSYSMVVVHSYRKSLQRNNGFVVVPQAPPATSREGRISLTIKECE